MFVFVFLLFISAFIFQMILESFSKGFVLFRDRKGLDFYKKESALLQDSKTYLEWSRYIR